MLLEGRPVLRAAFNPLGITLGQLLMDPLRRKAYRALCGGAFLPLAQAQIFDRIPGH